MKINNIIKYIIIVIIIGGVAFFGYNKYYNQKFISAINEASKTPNHYWDDEYKLMKIKNKYKIVIIPVNGGELTYAEYFKYSAERLGWEVKIFNGQTIGHEDEILDFDPDFMIFACYANSFLDSRLNAHRSKKYSLNFVSVQQLRQNGYISNKDPYRGKGYIKKINDIAHGVMTVADEVDYYNVMFKKLKKPFFGLKLFPLVPRFDNEPAEPKNLMWMAGGWDKFRSSQRYRKFITMLSENVPFRVYGHYNTVSYLKPHTYAGYIKPGIENVNAIRNNGIYLLSHSDFHFQANVPSMKPFEAAAANVIVISDKLPFVVENFGDSFLYFDQDADSEEMYKQVKAHMDWIKEHPNEAKAKAAKAHQIFLDKFTLEKDLVRIAKMHEYALLQDKKQWDLEYPLGY